MDTSKRTPGEEELLIKNDRLIWYYIKKYFPIYVSKPSAPIHPFAEELHAAGMYGLLKAIRTYDPEKSKLATYASKCIINEMFMLTRRKKKDAVLVSLEEPLAVDTDGNELTVLDIVPDKENDFAHFELMDLLDRTFLTERERFVIKSYFVDGFDQIEIGIIMGLSQSYVSRIKLNALKKIKKELEDTHGYKAWSQGKEDSA
jgi:RNA polymerase sporulation-specific sigma factor